MSEFAEVAQSVVTKDGSLVKLRVAPLPPDMRSNSYSYFSQLKWDEVKLGHGDEVKMSAVAQGLADGTAVRFVVESKHGGAWQQYGTVDAKVASGAVTASLQVHHPAVKEGATPRSMQEVTAASLRFSVQAVE
jgi:hypothetical protein